MKDITIIGGGCAGLTAAVYGARAGKDVLVLEGGVLGGQISYSPRVENYPSIQSISGADFSEQLYEQALSLGVSVEFTEVTEVKMKDNHFVVVTGQGEFETRTVVIATGVKHRALDIDGEKAMAGHGVSYCATCDGAFFRNQKVAVVGGGNTALLGAEYLSSICDHVTLIHRRDAFRGEEALVKRLRGKDNVTLMTPYVVTKIEGEGALKGAIVKNVKDESETSLDVSGIFVLAGQIPNNDLFKDLVKLTEGGFIDAKEDCKTSRPGIFVAGDCREKTVRQLTTAASDGTVAALAASSYIDENF